MQGKILNNTFRLERSLTEGGMGQLYVASHLRISNRLFAIKRLRPELAASPAFLERFRSEADAMMRLEHPNIVRIEDFIEEDNQYFLIMEFVEGQPLDHRLFREKRFSPDVAVDISRQLLLALSVCHQKGLIHRDLKPSNILLTPSGQVKLTDFGIALREDLEEDKRLTRTGTIVGTPDYMSPEQIMGKALDGRSDLYSLGVILYEMLTGKPPFLRSAAAEGTYVILFAHVNTPAPEISEPSIPPNLRAIVAQCLEKNPQKRFQDADQMLAALPGPSDKALKPLPTGAGGNVPSSSFAPLPAALVAAKPDANQVEPQAAPLKAPVPPASPSNASAKPAPEPSKLGSPPALATTPASSSGRLKPDSKKPDSHVAMKPRLSQPPPKKSSFLRFLSTLLLLGIGAFGAFYFWESMQPPKPAAPKLQPAKTGLPSPPGPSEPSLLLPDQKALLPPESPTSPEPTVVQKDASAPSPLPSASKERPASREEKASLPDQTPSAKEDAGGSDFSMPTIFHWPALVTPACSLFLEKCVQTCKEDRSESECREQCWSLRLTGEYAAVCAKRFRSPKPSP